MSDFHFILSLINPLLVFVVVHKLSTHQSLLSYHLYTSCCLHSFFSFTLPLSHLTASEPCTTLTFSTVTVSTRQDPIPPGRPHDLSTVTVSTRQDPVPPGHPHDLSTVTVSTRQDPVPPGRPHDLSTVTVSTRQDPVPPGRPHDLSTVTVSTRQDPVPPGHPPIIFCKSCIGLFFLHIS